MISHKMINIALVTPLKDEIDNIDKFFKSVSEQSLRIKCLVIVENDSSDGSKEYLNRFKCLDNVEELVILNLTFDDKSYDLGFKYSKVVHHGFEYLKNASFYKELDFVGILDCDCFPEKDYYEKLVHFMDQHPKVGISSGLIFTEEGNPHIANTNWVRGGCRLWKISCFEDTGFPIEPSPDAITVALAHYYGWESKTLKDAKVTSREVNVRMSNYKNQGRRIYYRGNSLFYAFSKFAFYFFVKREIKIAFDFINGYLGDYFSAKPRIKDMRVRKYYQFYLISKLKAKF